MNEHPRVHSDEGRLSISANVLRRIVWEAASDVEGVAELCPLPQNWKAALLHAGCPDEVRVSVSGGTVCVEVGVRVRLGVSVPQLGCQLQKKIKAAVQGMTGLAVSQVHVYIGGLREEAAEAF